MMRMEIEGQMHIWTDNVKRVHPTAKTVVFLWWGGGRIGKKSNLSIFSCMMYTSTISLIVKLRSGN